MKDIKKSIAYSRGIWFCLTHSTFLNAYGYHLVKKDERFRKRVYRWINEGLISHLSSEGLMIYDSWMRQSKEGKIQYFRDHIPDSVHDMYAELYEADIWIPHNLISLDNDFHQIFIDCYLNNSYFKNDPPGVYIDGILNRGSTPYIKELIGYLYLLRVD